MDYKQEKESWVKEQVKIWLQYKSSSWTRMKMRMVYANFSKNNDGFFIKMNNILLLTSPNFGGSFKEIFK